MDMTRVKEVVKEIGREVVDVRVVEFDGYDLKSLEIVWVDGSRSLIPVKLFWGIEERLREEVKEVYELWREGYGGSDKEEKG